MATGGRSSSTPAQRDKVHTVMHEFKHGELHSGSKTGPLVTTRDQAVAIALNQAGLGRGDKKKRSPLHGIR